MYVSVRVRLRRGAAQVFKASAASNWVELLVSCYLSNTASFVLCVVYSVKDHHTLPDCSQLLKNTRVRQVVLDKWLPVNTIYN